MTYNRANQRDISFRVLGSTSGKIAGTAVILGLAYVAPEYLSNLAQSIAQPSPEIREGLTGVAFAVPVIVGLYALQKSLDAQGRNIHHLETQFREKIDRAASYVFGIKRTSQLSDSLGADSIDPITKIIGKSGSQTWE